MLPNDNIDVELRCSSCDKLLVELMVQEKPGIINRIVATCPCGDKSFKKEVKGKIYFYAAEGVTIENVDYTQQENDNHMINEVIFKTK